jgi:hypothetical protein
LQKPASIGFDHVSHHRQKKAEWTNRVMFGINGLELALLGGLGLLAIAAGILPNPFAPRPPGVTVEPGTTTTIGPPTGIGGTTTFIGGSGFESLPAARPQETAPALPSVFGIVGVTGRRLGPPIG